ncbi:MAG: hypothetical protein GX117_11065 [Candidatus Hydrogenedentes bacterium]|nr:hypothetical protein [Candidatus Hydrogenedentota bacterium]
MTKSIEELIQELGDKSAGWATRRNAAELLGKHAHRIVSELLFYKNDSDMDVKMEVERSITPLSLLLSDQSISDKQYTLRELALACEKRQARHVETYQKGFVVTLRGQDGESQRVYINSVKSSDIPDSFRIFMLCGEITEENYPFIMTANSKLVHASFSIISFEGNKQLALVINIPVTDATPNLVKRSVKEIAYYGSWMEKKLSEIETP